MSEWQRWQCIWYRLFQRKKKVTGINSEWLQAFNDIRSMNKF